ncbi:AAA family ATPase [Shewanella psychrotolerans]|uniref:AAA family ATPase n=1 Tax=Shewanella psychrotolerans TaxID=2864206 RepID=UPI001C655A1A|nr:AAA family ATPase [Shewanella psychrotolerans]QYK00358.1 ATP-binding protein [Shewanella psychrotolerans]
MINFQEEIFQKKYHYTGARLGRFIPRANIKNAIIELSGNSSINFSNIFRVLSYIGYDKSIGFKLHDFKPMTSIDTMDIDKWELYKDFNRLIYLMNELDYRVRLDVIWFDDSHQYDEVYDELLVDLLRMEPLLRKHKVITSVEIYLSKNGSKFTLKMASSGELLLISTLVFISSYIKDDSLILIDEPENSLHPKWQKHYVTMILDLFHYYNPKIIIGTHSPTIISGLANESLVDIHKFSGEKFELVNIYSKNTEDIYDSLFDLITPSNRSLSNNCAEILNKVSCGDISSAHAIGRIKSYIDK